MCDTRLLLLCEALPHMHIELNCHYPLLHCYHLSKYLTVTATLENITDSRLDTDLEAQEFVLMLKEAMVPSNNGVVSNSHTFILAQAFH